MFLQALREADVELDWSLARECLSFQLKPDEPEKREPLTPSEVVVAFQEAESWLQATQMLFWESLVDGIEKTRRNVLRELVTARGDRVAELQGFLRGMEAVLMLPEQARRLATRTMRAVEAANERRVR